MRRFIYPLCTVIVLLGLNACSSNTYHKGPRTVAQLIDDAKLAREAGKIPDRVKVGRPYVIKGKRYHPSYNPHYREVGLASWYGPGFHGKSTANGERYDQHDLTAAHKTLPLPSLVKVENLDNGKELIVRVNDRGPYADGRIIDLSKRSAQLLGSDVAGLARVRVTLLEQESRELWTALNLRLHKDIPASAAQPVYAAAQPERYETLPESLPPTLPPRQTVTPQAPVAMVASAPLEAPSTTYADTQYADADAPTQLMELPEADWPHAQNDARHRADMPAYNNLAAIPSSEIHYESQPTPTQGVMPAPRFIQAAAYANHASASHAASRLTPYGNVVMESVHVNGRQLYRVRIGPLSPADPVATLHARIIDMGFTDAALVY